MRTIRMLLCGALAAVGLVGLILVMFSPLARAVSRGNGHFQATPWRLDDGILGDSFNCDKDSSNYCGSCVKTVEVCCDESHPVCCPVPDRRGGCIDYMCCPEGAHWVCWNANASQQVQCYANRDDALKACDHDKNYVFKCR